MHLLCEVDPQFGIPRLVKKHPGFETGSGLVSPVKTGTVQIETLPKMKKIRAEGLRILAEKHPERLGAYGPRGRLAKASLSG